MLIDAEIRDMYELFNDSGRADSVNDAFDAVQETLKGYNLKTSNTDTAENLVTALMRYVLESGNDSP